MDNFKFKENKLLISKWKCSNIWSFDSFRTQCTISAIIANRASGTFSADPYKAVDELIGYTLDRLAKKN
jgi:uridine phosphorylase